MIRQINIRLSVLRRELPIMLMVCFLLWPVLAPDSYLSRAEGVVLLAVFAILLILSIYGELRDSRAKPAEVAEISRAIDEKKRRGKKPISVNIIFIVLGLAGLALGADLAVRGAVFIGAAAGLSETVIGLTIIAVGTSLPELVTCMVAAFKGHDDISVGTLVGSNVFNALLAIGCAGVIRPFAVNQRLVGFDYWIMILISAAFILTAAISKRINRPAGLGLV